MRSRIYDIARDENNNPLVGASVSLRRLVDNSEIDSTVTDASGAYSFSEEEVGYPGPIKVRITSLDGVTRERTGRSTGQTGTYFHSDLMRAFSVMTDGVVYNYDNELEVTADGVDREVTVDSGLAFVAGHPLFFPVETVVPITANISGNPRIDTIAVSFTMPSETVEGKAEIIAVPGSAAPSPVAPTLTQSTALWQIRLANVAVANGASSISLGNVTDGRTYSTGPLTDNSIETAHIQDGAVTNVKLGTAIDALKIANGTVTNTEFQYIGNLSSDAQVQLNAKAATVHTHLLAAGATDVTASAAELNILDGALLTTSELNFVDGVTSGIQLQLDGKSPTGHTHAGSVITSGTVGISYLPTGTSGTTVALGNHVHAGADITSGTVAIGRLPTGTTGSTVALGDHGHAAYAALAGATFTGNVIISDTGDLWIGSSSPSVLSNNLGGLGISTDVTINGNLSSYNLDTGEVIASSNIVTQGDVTIGTATTGGKIKIPERTTKPTLALGSASGTGGSLAISIIRGGSDTAGVIRIVTGSSGVAAGELCSVTFATARATNEYGVHVTGQSASSDIDLHTADIQAGSFDIRCGDAPTTGATIDIFYTVFDLV